jgi:hypothetical protein
MIFGLFGKALEVSGKILQAKGVEEYLVGRGEAAIEDYVVSMGKKKLSNRKARKLLLANFKEPLKDRQFRARIDKTWDDYLSICGETCDLVFYSLGFYSKDLILLPTSFLADSSFPICAAEISNTEVFQKLYPSELLQGFFFEVWKEALLDQIDSESPDWNNPLALGDNYCIVGIDPDLNWSGSMPKGAYYVLKLKATELTKALRAQVKTRINDLDILRASVTSHEVDQATKTYEAIRASISNKPDWHKLKMASKPLPMKLRVGW